MSKLSIQIDSKKALEFLRGHPAFAFESGDSICSGFWFMQAICCKRNHCEEAGKYGITIYRSDPRWDLYADLVDEEDKGSNDSWVSVEVPYERMYGEPWAPDHMEYWFETTFFVFEGDPYKASDMYDPTKWGRYSGPEGGAKTFERMLIKAAKEVKKVYGDFNTYESFYTEAELANHKAVEPMLFHDCKDSRCKQIEFNTEYVDVNNSLINHRWVEWYMTTKHAKNWKHDHATWKTFIEQGKALEPQHRKNILEKYGKRESTSILGSTKNSTEVSSS